jgi:hypothetical protein
MRTSNTPSNVQSGIGADNQKEVFTSNTTEKVDDRKADDMKRDDESEKASVGNFWVMSTDFSLSHLNLKFH